jgi:hypothetical protein
MTVTEICKIKVTYEFPAGQQGNGTVEIGYRIQGSGSSYTTVVELGSPASNPYIFEQVVPCPTGCDAIVYEGYIKGCDDIEIPWVVTFINTNQPDCYEAEWICNNVGVLAVNPVAAGSGYQVGDTVTFQGGGGSGAAGTVTQVAGSGSLGSNSIVITNPGTGYTSPPTAVVASQNGTGLTSNTILDNCATLTHTFCAGDPSGNKDIQLALGESYIECTTLAGYNTKVNSLSRDEISGFITQMLTTNCGCADCKKVTVENLTSKGVIIMYNTCDASGQDPSLPAGSLVFKTLNQLEVWTSPCHLLCETVTTNAGNQTGTVLNLTNCSDCS